MLNIINNQKCKLKLHKPTRRRLKITNVGKVVEQTKLSDVVGGSVTWYNHFGKIPGSFF